MSEPAPFHQLRPRTLIRHQVFERLADDIITGRLLPMEEIRDGDLQSEYGVSRTPIREAILQLADLGLIQLRSNRYTRVASIDMSEHIDYWEAAHSLFAHSAEIIAPRLSSAQRAGLSELAAGVLAFNAGQHVALQSWYDFHAEIVDIANNTVASALLHNRLRLHILRPVPDGRRDAEVSDRLRCYLLELTAAFERRDGTAARELVMDAFDVIAQSLRGSESLVSAAAT